MIVHTILDLRRYVSDQFARIDLSCYTADFDRLVDHATEYYKDQLSADYGFTYGNEQPDNDIDLYKYLEEFEK